MNIIAVGGVHKFTLLLLYLASSNLIEFNNGRSFALPRFTYVHKLKQKKGATKGATRIFGPIFMFSS
jgi:hypothetical protein